MSQEWAQLEEEVRAKASGLTPTLARTAAWLADHLPDVAWRTVDEVAQAAGVSAASVVRCLQELGYDGYSAFRRAVRQGLPASELVWELTRETRNSAATAMSEVIQHEQEGLSRLEELISTSIGDFIDDLLAARTVIFTGSITSGPLAAYAGAQLNLLLGKVRYLDAASSDAWLYTRDAVREDVVVGVTFPRYSQATLRLLDRLAPKVRRVWLLTDRMGPSGFDDRGRVVHLPVDAHGRFGSSASFIVLVQILARLLTDRAPDIVLGKVDDADAAWLDEGLLSIRVDARGKRRQRKI